MNGETDIEDKPTWLRRIGAMLGITNAHTPQHPASGKFHPPATIVDAHAKVGAGLQATQAAAVAGSKDKADSDGIVPQPERDIESECNCGGACEECKGKDIENANPEGCNQYKPCGGGSDKDYKKADRHSKEAYKKGAEADENVHLTPRDAASAHKTAMKAHQKAAKSHADKDTVHFHKEEASRHEEEWVAYDLAAKTGKQTRNEDTTMTRTEIINHLTTNCDCWKGGAETLNTLTDAQLVAIKQNAEKVAAYEPAAASLVALAKANGAPADLTANAIPAFIQKKIDAKKKGKKKKDDDEDEEETENADPEEDDDEEDEDAMKKNSKRLSMNQWRKIAPLEVLARDDAAREVVQNETNQLVQRLTANVAESERDEVARTLAAKSIPDLRLMVKLLPPVRNQQQQVHQPFAIFQGAGGNGQSPTGNAKAYEPGDGLEIPALVGNFAAERDAEQKRQQSA